MTNDKFVGAAGLLYCDMTKTSLMNLNEKIKNENLMKLMKKLTQTSST